MQKKTCFFYSPVVLYSGVVNMIISHERKIYMEFLWYHYLLGIVLVVSSILIVILVMLQQSQQQGLSGAIAGGSDSFFDKNKGRTKEAQLAKLTNVFAIVFCITALAAVVIFAFTK